MRKRLIQDTIFYKSQCIDKILQFNKLIKNNNKNQITYIKKPSKIQSQDELLNKKPIIYISYLAS
ncbi:hypothetical protein EGT64_03055 [Acinetobacter junii]|nr:hypothetical protein BVL33_05425 [Acinetobacter junii]RSE37737.1 hypothetical protein EGT64_03055 [Acinetobacter junii]